MRPTIFVRHTDNFIANISIRCGQEFGTFSQGLVLPIRRCVIPMCLLWLQRETCYSMYHGNRKGWVAEGSIDGKNWIDLDKYRNSGDLTERNITKTYSVKPYRVLSTWFVLEALIELHLVFQHLSLCFGAFRNNYHSIWHSVTLWHESQLHRPKPLALVSNSSTRYWLPPCISNLPRIPLSPYRLFDGILTSISFNI